MVGASSGPPDSMTRTCAPDADNSAARTEPAAPAPTTMKSYRFSSFDTFVILNPQDLKSDFSDYYLNPTISCRSRAIVSRFHQLRAFRERCPRMTCSTNSSPNRLVNGP